MVTGNILKESYRWQFTNSMLDCTLNCLKWDAACVCVWGGGGGGGGWNKFSLIL